MPEIKNTFLKGKMNKDLDDRLLPEGEYRDAVNIQVSKSDENNIGSVQTLRGNKLAYTTEIDGTFECIGSFFDEKSNRVFWFLTDDLVHKLVVLEQGGEPKVILEGSYLNFNKENLITGINLIEDLLFWTDDRNEPRRINVETAISYYNDNSEALYYENNDKINVAKIAPYTAPELTLLKDTSIDSDFLELKFPRFSYRYKFLGNEYSTLAPFSQAAFKLDNDIMTAVEKTTAYEDTENPMVVNDVNKVEVKIKLPNSILLTGADDAAKIAQYIALNKEELKSIDIIYKESDSIATRIVDTVNIGDIASSITIVDKVTLPQEVYYTYTYKSTLPKYTLAEEQITRVYDNVPRLAKAQEVAGNRVIYGNFVEGFNSPSLDYSISVSQKYTTEYPNHSIKQKRKYTVGIVLSDKYGRSTPVILSSTNPSTIYVDIKEASFDAANWIGDSLKLIFYSNIPNAYDATTNPNGWYSYKVVIKQQEQDYYNVYHPGISDNFVTLFSDNVNKIPKDTTAAVTSQGLLPGDVRVLPRLINKDYGAPGTGGLTWARVPRTEQYYTDRYLKVKSIGSYTESGLGDAPTGFYKSNKGNLLGLIESQGSSNDGWVIGVDRSVYGPTLSVLETEPTLSALDIYYETSTAGLVSDINGAADLEIDSIVLYPTSNSTGTDPNISFSESIPGHNAVASIAVFSGSTQLPDGSVAIDSVNGNASQTDFSITFNYNTGLHEIVTENEFVYDSLNADYTFSLTATFANDTFQVTDKVISITDAAPTISVFANKAVPVSTSTSTSIGTITGTNGSADAANNGVGVTFTLVAQYTVSDTNDTGITEITSNQPFTLGTYTADSGTIEVYPTADLAAFTPGIVKLVFKATENSVDTDLTPVYITVIAGATANSTTSGYNENIDAYGSNLDACVYWNSLPQRTVYHLESGNALENAYSIFYTADLSKAAPSGFYTDGQYSGKWIYLGGSSGYWAGGTTTQCNI
ncbi:MAG TPA: hypothetical protein DEQ56_07440 [Bacteroidetes bacterium]|nr:hypothetical protein [Bacteroidota bacterium]